MVINLFPKQLVHASSKQPTEPQNIRFSILVDSGGKSKVVAKTNDVQYTFSPGPTMSLTDTKGCKVRLYLRGQGKSKYYEVKLEGYECHYSDIVITTTSLEYTDANGIPRIFEWTNETNGVILRSTLPSKPNIDYATVKSPSFLSFGALAHFDILPCLAPADYALYIAFLMVKLKINL